MQRVKGISLALADCLRACCCAGEQKAGDRGAIARASGDYAIVVAHNPEAGITRIKLPSGSKKVSQASSSLDRSCISVILWSLPNFLPFWIAPPFMSERTGPLYSIITHAAACKCPAELLIAEDGCAGDPQHMPRHDWPGGRWWQDREAHAEGRQCLPQVQGQEEQLAQGMSPLPRLSAAACQIPSTAPYSTLPTPRGKIQLAVAGVISMGLLSSRRVSVLKNRDTSLLQLSRC